MASMARMERGAEGSQESRVPPEGARRVGAALRQAREERGFTLEEAGNAIRCSGRQVRAVEEALIGELPPHPFARGLVTAYASFLGLDAEAAAQQWGRPVEAGEAGTRSVFRVPIRPRSSWRDWAIPVACAFGTVVALALISVLRPAPVEIPADQPSARAEKPSLPQPEPTDAGAALPAPVAAEGNLAVSLRSEGVSWIEVAIDGEAPRRQELRPGENVELRAMRRLGLALGDAGAVRLTVNGRDLGFIGDRGEIRRGIVFEAPADALAARRSAAGN
jgi:hypothetical protein